MFSSQTTNVVINIVIHYNFKCTVPKIKVNGVFFQRLVEFHGKRFVQVEYIIVITLLLPYILKLPTVNHP